MSRRKSVSRLSRVAVESLESRTLFSLASAASDVYIYGLAPVLANITQQIDTNVSAQSNSTGQAPANQFANEQTYPTPTNSVIVRPNADTLYSTAWLNLASGPIVLHTPDTGSNFELFQFLDAYTNTFAGIGTRTTGSGAQNVLIAGPNWSGTVPQGLTLIKAPTNTVWIIGRIAVPQDSNGNPQFGPINALQAQLSLTPLANYLTGNYTPPTNVPITPLSAGLSASETDDQNVLGLSAQNYFTLLSQVLKVNPPPATDNALISELAEFNLGPGQHFNWSTLTPAQQTALTQGQLLGEQRLVSDGQSGVGVTEVTSTNWTERLQDGEIGDYGTNYDARAVIAYGGLGANLPEDAIYPSTSVDSNGAALNGANNYTVTFPAGDLPPASAFWSLTVYNSSGYFISNPINRYSIGSLDSGLQFNADGSLTLYLQNTEPASGASNWLPIPTGAFNLTFRLYDPQASALNGTWVPPAVVSAQQTALNTAATQAYQYGYPLVLQDLSEQIATDVPSAEGTQAPANQLVNETLAPLSEGYGPNADTLYSFGWLDLSQQPIVLHVPDTNGRFYSFELIDAWTNAFSVIGERTTGTAEGDYAIVGPNWTGTLPAGVTEVKAPTDLVELIGRTLVYGSSDIPAATAIQAQYSLTPLSDYGQAYTPPTNVPVNPNVNTTESVQAQIAQLTGPEFFQLLAQALINNPPLAGDTAAALSNLAAVGITPGQPLNLSSLTAGQLAATGAAGTTGRQLVGGDAAKYPTTGVVENGWTLPPADVSDYGTNYADRAGAAEDGYTGTNLPADAIYPGINVDSNGVQLNGANNNYTITFPAGDLPPAEAFWSLTLYQYDGNIADLKLYPNAENVYEIGNRTPFVLNSDGSLTIYIQNQSPGAALASNWLPAPAGEFQLTLRLYTPEQSALDGQWQPPSVYTTQQTALNTAAVSAYEYLYPLVNQYYTEQQQTDVSAPDGDTSQAPINQLFNNSLAPLENNTGPNADTLYTGGWLDLSNGPIVLHVPDFDSRYYSVELADAWTNTFSILGTQTTGTAAGDYAIVGPGWTGALPAGVTAIQAPTNLVELLARTLVYGQSDLSTADSYRQQFSLTPLADYGTDYTPPTNVPVNPNVDTTDPVAQQIAGLTGAQFFALAAQLLQSNPPLAADAGTGILNTLAQIGLTPSQAFNPANLTVGQLAAVAQASAAGTARVAADASAFERSGTFVGQWYDLPADVAEYGTNYADRAGAAYTGVFVLTNPPAEALYLSAFTDSTGQPLDGTNDYEITFPAGDFPPSQYFWSLTLYQANNELYPNSYNIYEVGNRSPYQLNADGSLTIYVGNTPPPAGLQSNWIPAPAGAFTLTLRIYGPDQSALNGQYIPPPVIQTSYAAAGSSAAVSPSSSLLLDATVSSVLD